MSPWVREGQVRLVRLWKHENGKEWVAKVEIAHDQLPESNAFLDEKNQIDYTESWSGMDEPPAGYQEEAERRAQSRKGLRIDPRSRQLDSRVMERMDEPPAGYEAAVDGWIDGRTINQAEDWNQKGWEHDDKPSCPNRTGILRYPEVELFHIVRERHLEEKKDWIAKYTLPLFWHNPLPESNEIRVSDYYLDLRIESRSGWMSRQRVTYEAAVDGGIDGRTVGQAEDLKQQGCEYKKARAPLPESNGNLATSTRPTHIVKERVHHDQPPAGSREDVWLPESNGNLATLTGPAHLVNERMHQPPVGYPEALGGQLRLGGEDFDFQQKGIRTQAIGLRCLLQVSLASEAKNILTYTTEDGSFLEREREKAAATAVPRLQGREHDVPGRSTVASSEAKNTLTYTTEDGCFLELTENFCETNLQRSTADIGNRLWIRLLWSLGDAEQRGDEFGAGEHKTFVDGLNARNSGFLGLEALVKERMDEPPAGYEASCGWRDRWQTGEDLNQKETAKLFLSPAARIERETLQT
ncbi:hypothetical protein C8F01DRAFT_1092937 [Mycena amicta]|nr:hypothetical protein C8F01DRAFT_1092937 [Mycena amicta]